MGTAQGEIFLRFLARGLPAIKDPLTCSSLSILSLAEALQALFFVECRKYLRPVSALCPAESPGLDIALVLLTFVERMAAGASMARSLPSIRLLRPLQ